MRTNEEIIYRIIKRNLLIILLAPMFLVGAYFGYSQLGNGALYSATTRILVNEDLGEIPMRDRNTAIATIVEDLASSSLVLERVIGDINLKDVSVEDLQKKIEAESSNSAFVIDIEVKAEQEAEVLALLESISDQLTDVVEEIYDDVSLLVIDKPLTASQVVVSVSRTRLVGVFAIGFISTLMLVLGLNWKKESKQ